MIFHKMWRVKGTGGEEWHREGWYLFGVLPLYIKTTRHTYLT